ncbi:hypothetical protein BDW68DRAFT_192486 [Aspergillus falconensis]
MSVRDLIENTWTDQESKTNWLKDLLPGKTPYARILAYCYNANILFGAPSAGIEEQAKNLLCLSAKRKLPRPIIFLAHSMGGILVKDALATAYHGDEAYAPKATMTYGIFFFGIPHYGSRHSPCGQQSFLNFVEAQLAYNDELNSRFLPLLEMYRFLTFSETKDAVGLISNLVKIVDSDSAILKGCPRQQVAYWPNRTHRALCKFASTDPEWQLILEMLTGWANLAVKCTSYSPLSSIRSEVLQNRLWDPEETEETHLIPPLEAIEKAQTYHDIVTEDSQRGGKLYRSVHWLWSIVLQIIRTFLVPTMLASLFSRAEKWLRQRRRKAQAKEQRIMEVEKDVIESLHRDKAWVLGNIALLEGALAFPPRMIFDIRRYNKSYLEARRRVNLIEDAKRETAGRSYTEFWVVIGERAQEEQRLQESRRTENMQERTENIQEERDVCPCAIL